MLYLRARDRHTRPATLRFSPPGPARRDTVPHSRRHSPNTIIHYARILLVAFPRSVSYPFHNTWHLQSFGSYFRMTANAFSLFLGCKKHTGIPCTIQNFEKISENPKTSSKSPFPTHVNSRGRIWIRPHQGSHFSRFSHGYFEGRQIV